MAACKVEAAENFLGLPGNENVKTVDGVETLAACSALCTKNAKCTYFVFQKKSGSCWLKKNYTHKQKDDTCQSGFRCAGVDGHWHAQLLII